MTCDDTGSPKLSWCGLSSAQRGAVVAVGGLQIGLLAAALIDIRRRPASRVHGRKSLWVAASFVNFIGPVAYFRFGRRR